MPILGAHQSISGGFDRAVERAAATGCDCVQLFSKNSNQWKAKPIADEEVARFQASLREKNIAHPIVHDSYLINLASPDDVLWRRSIEAFYDELHRAEKLGIPYVVTHPGSYTDSDEATGLQRIVAALDEIHDRAPALKTQCLLETTAGQGTNLGRRFEHLATILDGVRVPQRLGVCFDTCHVFAAGYPLQTEEEYQQTFEEFDRLIGLGRLKAFHLNDSKKERGSRVDRHEHIGRGCLGLEPFRHLLRDPRFQEIPMYLETPKGSGEDGDWDVNNLKTLRELI